MDMLSLLQKQQLVERINQVKEGKKMTWERIAHALYQILEDMESSVDEHSEEYRAAFDSFRAMVLEHAALRNLYLNKQFNALQKVNEDLEADKREEIPLTNTQLKAMVDPEDFDRVAKLSWFLKTDARTNVHYVAHSERVGKQVKTIRLHRFIMNAGPDVDVHHKDLNPLNCHRDNLEVIPKDTHRNYHTKRHWQRVPALTTEESIKECVCHIYEMDNDELCRFYRAMPKSYIGPDGKRFETYGFDKVTVESEIKKRGMTLPILDESSISEPEHTNHTDWARRELQLAGLFDKDSDYDGMLGEAVMDLIDKFSEQGHSGFSASMVASIFDRLVRWKPLTELTDDPSEWNEIAEEQASHFPGHDGKVLDGKVKLYQSRRSPDCFSEDGGLTYYSINDPCFEGTEENGAKYQRCDPETWAKVTIHTAKKKE